MTDKPRTEIWRDGSLVAYDRVPYRSFPFAQSHPDRAATIGRLLGLDPPSVETARIVELGCASGGNLLPMAVQLPSATFLGIDGSARQIETAEGFRRGASLSNVELRHQDILDFTDVGPFDYIVVHGVFSWVPTEVQDRILQIVGETLAPDGIAYISFNTFPGWHLRGMVREMMLFAAQPFVEPTEQLQAAVEYLNSWIEQRPEKDPLAELLKPELQIVQQSEASYLMHDHLEAHNAPVYFGDFMQRAGSQGLAYLGEADFGLTDRANFPVELREQVDTFSEDLVRSEQHLDFLRNNTFRQSLLCRQGIQADRTFEQVNWNSLYVATDATVGTVPLDVHSRADVYFRRRRAVMRTNEPLIKAAMLLLTDAWPKAIRYGELLQSALAMVGDDESNSDTSKTLTRLLRRAFGAEVVELRSAPPRLRVEPGEQPLGSELGREQSKRGQEVTNQWHTTVAIDSLRSAILNLCDGNRNLFEIARMAASQLSPHQEGTYDDQQLAQIERSVQEALRSLGRMGLLVD